ncbi:Scarecrow-like transcription factor PAT1 [Linum grandiflorum]
MSGGLYYQPMQEFEANYMPQFQNLAHQLCYNGGSTQATHFPFQTEQYCTLESSSLNGTTFAIYNNFSPTGSSMSYPSDHYSSPMSSSCITDDVNDIKHKLKELETAMLGPDSDNFVMSMEGNVHDWSKMESPEMDCLREIMGAISRGELKQVLVACANAVSENDHLIAQWLIDELRNMVSVSGEPIQRLGAYMLEGLVARMSSSGSTICKSLRCKDPASADLLSYMHILYEVCPYLKFGYMSANGAIAEAMKDENRVHIVDFQIGQGSQWISLIQAFAARPGGPPFIRITGVDDSTSAYARGGGLNIVGKRLSKLAKSFKVPFEFRSAALNGCDVQVENLEIRPGEALAVNFAFMLHHMPDESVSTENHRDRLLRLVKGLSPKVVTLVEQEANTNTAAFFPRFMETLDYYTAMFESMDVTLQRDHKDRISIEQHCLAKDVVNVIACEGGERLERHELLGKWKSRFSMAGFSPCPLSSLVNATIKTLLANYSKEYRLEERGGALYLGWKKRDLVASCAWKITGRH